MSWTEVRVIPNEYNEEAEKIDYQLIQLVKHRRKLSAGKRFFPPEKLLEQWAEEFDLDIDKIHYILHNLEENQLYFEPEGPGSLKTVVPLMKKKIAHDCEHVLTHMMQYERGSVVKMNIKYTGKDASEVMLQANLILEVISKQVYQVTRYGSSGSTARADVDFLVVPPLPENLEEVEFSLVRSHDNFTFHQREIVLNQQVDFE